MRGVLHASPFLRTVETADEICRELETTVLLEPGLGEHRNAEWFDAEPEILSPATLADRFETVRLDHDPLVVPEFPETHAEAMARAGETTRQLAATTEGTVLLVGHGLTIGGVVQGLVGSAGRADAPLCGLTRIDRDGEAWELVFSGETTHLDQ